MIFNTTNTSAPEVGVGRYEATLEGALMYVYENECNYNALIKAVGLSELKYYQETGKDLFVHEAGALKEFGSKVVAFFKKIIEKIKQLFHKFAVTINSIFMNDKDFVKKYKNEILRKQYEDLELKGHNFNFDFTLSEFKQADIDTIAKKDDIEKSERDDLVRQYMTGSNDPVSLSDFNDLLKEKIYGDEVDIEINPVQLRKDFETISNASKLINAADNRQKKIVNTIKNASNTVDKEINRITNKDASLIDELNEIDNEIIKELKNTFDILEAESNTFVTYFGTYTQALKDARKEAKARCVKAVQYTPKNESAYSESSLEDLFAGVTIR